MPNRPAWRLGHTVSCGEPGAGRYLYSTFRIS
jgi:hypothetical protein